MNEPVTQPKKIRKKFDKEFKQRAVELWLSSGRPVTHLAAELGIDAQRLCAWRTHFAPPSGAKPTADQLEAQIAKLQRENEHLRQQRDILKKTLGILSEPSSNDISGSKP